MQFFVED